ncbi:flagellin [Sporomusa acidovorans]|uniref:Flagellin n=1 Tax=Sporomusa acidovorans (strain ATCC 49682 / DSM 3132 / Mol) TaxID=1123286 RepID=A0ABZ3IXJ9_SPOA4|nr:flagellin [Sporomusa acidovorans]OZC22412.1 flagellar hook-associated protein 3 [Sporomusa acidovorans DSM 3132]SDE48515.1 flagellar hook-associated protein 3 FlgL [Sporomusa acidovorans]
MYRITNGMIAANTLRNISAAAVRLAAANEAVSSNMKIQLASDDPTVATRAVTYRSYVAQIEQYQDNADLATAWQKTTDSALSSLSDVITSLKTIANGASSDTVTDDDLENYATTVETDLQNIITYMNADESGSYVFGGYNTSEEPYELVTTDIGNTVTFKGQYLSLGGVISSDVSDEDIEAFITDSSSDVYDSLNDAADNAYTAYTKAQVAADADSSNAILAAKAASALATYTTVNTAVSTYGGATNLTEAAADAENTYDTLKTAITTYGGTATLTDAAADALSTADTLAAAVTTYGDSYTLTAAKEDAYSDYQTAYAADPTSSTTTAAKATYDALAAAITTYGSTTTLSEAAEAAEATSDTLAAAESTYGSSTTLADAATAAKNTADVLSDAVADSEQDITYNVGFSSEVTVNIEGQDVTGEGSDNLFNTVQKLLLALNGDTTYKSATIDASGNVTVTTNTLDISDLIDELGNALDRITSAQGTLGASMDGLTDISDSLDDAYEAYSTLMTDNENIDTATAATELTEAQYTYSAALAVGAKVISKTLIDYLG